MAAKGAVVILVFSLALLFSIGSVYCDGSMEDTNKHLNQFGELVKDKAKDMSNSASDAMGHAQKASESWTTWAKDKLQGIGFSMGSDDSKQSAPASKDGNTEKTN